MKKALIIVGSIVLLIVVCYVGIPSRLINKNIDDKTMNDIREVNQILVKAQSQIPLDSIPGFTTPLMPDDYGFISLPNRIDRLFSFLSNVERQKIKDMLAKGEVVEFDIRTLGCIKYTVKSSISNYFINSSHETINLVYKNNSDCDCDRVYKNEKLISKQKLEQYWFKIDLITLREAIHC